MPLSRQDMAFAFITWSYKRGVNLLTLVRFLVKTLILLLPFFLPKVQPVAKNRFSDEFVWVQNGVGLRMMQNEYLFQGNAICNRFWAAWCQM